VALRPAAQWRYGDGEHEREHDGADDAGGGAHACADDDGGGNQQDDRDPGQAQEWMANLRVSRVIGQSNVERDGCLPRDSRPVRSGCVRCRILGHRCLQVPAHRREAASPR
jgi:hypothetical protein